MNIIYILNMVNMMMNMTLILIHSLSGQLAFSCASTSFMLGKTIFIHPYYFLLMCEILDLWYLFSGVFLVLPRTNSFPSLSPVDFWTPILTCQNCGILWIHKTNVFPLSSLWAGAKLFPTFTYIRGCNKRGNKSTVFASRQIPPKL